MITIMKIIITIASVNTTSMSNGSIKVHCKKIKYYSRRENKVIENKVLSYCEALRYMSNLIHTILLNLAIIEHIILRKSKFEGIYIRRI